MNKVMMNRIIVICLLISLCIQLHGKVLSINDSFFDVWYISPEGEHGILHYKQEKPLHKGKWEFSIGGKGSKIKLNIADENKKITYIFNVYASSGELTVSPPPEQ